MLIVVLDDDDELVVGKTQPKTPTQPLAATRTAHAHKQQQPQQQPQQQQSRNSPSRTGKASRQKPRQQPIMTQQRDYRSEQRDYRSERSPNKTQKLPRERPMINTQKLAQRLHTIKQDQEREAQRAKSPLKDQTTDRKSTRLNSSHVRTARMPPSA